MPVPSAATRSPSNCPVRVLVVDDQSIVRRAIRTWLETRLDIEVVGEAASGEAALSILGRVRPDVILMDLIMPGQGGVETIRRIAETGLETRILVLTSFVTDLDITPAFAAGADACIAKDAEAHELVRAIRRVARSSSGTTHPDNSGRAGSPSTRRRDPRRDRVALQAIGAVDS
jgi:DNA-binding NarL/FixJ family response regulator